MLKTNSAIRKLVQDEFIRGIAPVAIIDSFRGNQRLSGDLFDNAGGRFLTRQTVVNTAQEWSFNNPNKKIKGNNDKIQSQVSNAKEWLEQ